jgi:hypothetical protein
MSARTAWTVGVLGAAVVAVALLRSEPQRSAVSGGVTESDETAVPVERRAVDPAPQEASASTSAGESEAVPGSSTDQARRLAQTVPAPISEALEELKLPPVPELLATERALAAEGVDSSWSTATEASILGKIAQVTGLALVSLRVECRTTLCRLQLASPELASADRPNSSFPDLVNSFGLKPLWVMSVVDRNGTPISLAYLERGTAAGGSAESGPAPGR